MKQRATKFTTTYFREFSLTELKKAAKAAFILDLGGPEGMARRGLKDSAVKCSDNYERGVTCSIVSRACEIDNPTPIAFAEFPEGGEA